MMICEDPVGPLGNGEFSECPLDNNEEGEQDLSNSKGPVSMREPEAGKTDSKLEDDGHRNSDVKELPQKLAHTRLGESSKIEKKFDAAGSGSASLPDVCLTDIERRGEGMNSYVVYKVNTKVVNNSAYSRQDYHVWRRYSDFLSLHEKLVSKHLVNGRIIPPIPEKSVIGMTKTKMSKSVEDESTAEYLERRRSALDRFLRRLSKHPVLQQDPDVKDFLTLDSELPKTTSSVLSGSHFVKLLRGVSDSITKGPIKPEDNDSWFEEKRNDIEALEEQLSKLHSSVDAMVHCRRDLSGNTEVCCKSLSMLAACEENTALSRAFSQLSEMLEKVAVVHHDQADKDFYLVSELLKDYIALIGAVKDSFSERERTWHNWQSAQHTLTKKREASTKLELQGRSDKLPSARAEVNEWEQKVQECTDNFEKISSILKTEICRFDELRVADLKDMVIKHLESLAATQQEIIKQWESFLPEAKAIVS